jgi:hypothetical protein
MKKIIVLSAIMAVTFLTWGFIASVYAQDTAKKDDKPTFYHLVPGTYVNGWPRFTITYPKDWVEGHLLPQEVFRAGVPGPPHGVTALHVSPFSARLLSLDKAASLLMLYAQAMDKDAIVVSDKPSQTRDGTPAREVDIQWFHEAHWLTLETKKDDCWINMGVYAPHKIGEDLKAILYSLRYEPGMDKPVTVPADIREFLDKFSSDMVSHDLAEIMTHYSDRFLNSGTTKKDTEESTRQIIGRTTSFEISITEFVPAGDKVYLAGFATSNAGKEPIKGVSIIKENGEWKWYGNQREAISFL